MNAHASYQIHVDGHLDERWLRWFDDHTVIHLDDGSTLIKLTAVDQLALFGVISRIRDLGIELVSVERYV